MIPSFLPDLLASDRTHTGNVSDSESLIHDSDCEELIGSPIPQSNGSQHVKVIEKNME